MSDSLRPHWQQHARLPCTSPTPELTQTHIHLVGDAIQPSHPLSPLLLSPSIFPSIRVFPNKSALHKSGGQSIGSSASASVLLMNIQDWFPFFSFSDFFHSSLSWDIEYSSLCYIVGPCLCIILIRVYWYQVHPKLPIHPSLPPLPLGNHKIALYVCKFPSVCK